MGETDPARQDEGESPSLCSRLSAERGLPLIGSAGSYDRVIAFELPSPWTPRLAGSRASDDRLDSVLTEISARPSVRLLALEPRDGSSELLRVLSFSRQPGLFGGYGRREFVAPRERLAKVLAGLGADDSGLDVVEGEVADPAGTAAGPVRDILVCTHGARDACCAKFGYPMFLRFEELAARRSEGGGQVRVWRSSHLGGHRFAPTLLDLPSGRMFGRLEEDDAAAVLDRGEALLGRLASIYRGRCALPEEVQIVERRLWEEAGREFEAASLSWRSEKNPGSSEQWTVDLQAYSSDRPLDPTRPQWKATAGVVRDAVDAVSTPASCGRDPETESPWRIVS